MRLSSSSSQGCPAAAATAASHYDELLGTSERYASEHLTVPPLIDACAYVHDTVPQSPRAPTLEILRAALLPVAAAAAAGADRRFFDYLTPYSQPRPHHDFSYCAVCSP